MNIYEAVNSYRPYRRKSWKNRGWVQPGMFENFTSLDARADDWEVEEERRELTWAEVFEALKVARSDAVDLGPFKNCSDALFFDSFKKKLGFKE